jgi:lipopolysaccharide/colanic/teichoic acid biosynthesis glycosyltransferase
MTLRSDDRAETAEPAGESEDYAWMELSSWTVSRAKRAMDVCLVLALIPVIAPLLLVTALAVLAASGAPVIFRQRRMGRLGKEFAIYKFRTMRDPEDDPRSALAADSADRVTALGFLLRRTKLDELPQVLNVLAGDMSLVGPRPRVLEQQFDPPPCRPGLTGPATLVFAQEETLLMQIPQDALTDYYRKTILPTKQRLDARYFNRATLLSDLRILLDTALWRWGSRTEIRLIAPEQEPKSASSEAAAIS